MKTMRSGIVLLGVLLIAATALADTEMAYDSAACIDCHDQNGGQSDLTIDVTAFESSVHGGTAECTDCHSQIMDETHTTTPGAGAVDCAACHDVQNRHGQGGTRENRPRCYHCHTRHRILSSDDPDAAIHPDHLADTCAECHPAQSGRVDYLSFLPSLKIATHPKADLAGRFDMDNCLGCHQGMASHGMDEAVSDDNCDRCHMPAEGRHPMLGVMHPVADSASQAGVFAVAVVYQALIGLLLIGGMAFFIRKCSGTRQR